MSILSTRPRRAVAVLVMVLTLVVGPAAAAVAADVFIKIDGVPGESVDEFNRDAIEVLSWSWGAANAGSSAGGGGGGAGKVSFQDLSFTKKLDKSSPLLLERLATGKHIAKAELVLRRTAGDEGSQFEYLKITLSDVLVTSYEVNGVDGERPTEEVSLNFSKVEFDYSTQGDDGGTVEKYSFGWDLKKNKSV